MRTPEGDLVARSEKSYFGLGRVPIGIGAVIKGWNITEERYRDPSKLAVVDFRAMTNACPHDCVHCFTDKAKRTLTLDQIKATIDQLSEMDTYAIDYLGEGEPTIDKDFWAIIEYTAEKGIQAVVYTDAATKLCDKEFVERLKRSGASVVPKCDSLWNAEYQNDVVQDKTGIYFDRRNEAVQNLIKAGFNEPQLDGTTRMGFDMVISRKNMHEVEKTLRYCRDNNIWVIFAFFLTSGRSGAEDFDPTLDLTIEERYEVAEMIARIDREEYGFDHVTINNFSTIPCVEFGQIYGDGRVSPCPGNEDIYGNILEESVADIFARILSACPDHDCASSEGYCPYRPKLDKVEDSPVVADEVDLVALALKEYSGVKK